MTDKPFIGIIGGSGLYHIDALTNVREVSIDTPFGAPSDKILTGHLHGAPVAFLARHGRGHNLLPSEIPYQANIYALKSLGVRYLISVSAVGSLHESMRPLDMVLPDQFIDMTKNRAQTFFGQGAMAHVSMAQPVCAALTDILVKAFEATAFPDIHLHQQGTYVCIEGPSFSTLAESLWYRSMPAHIIGMTNMPEAKLAREAQIAYATLALVTDYDCWHPREANVTAEMAIANLRKNAVHAQQVLIRAIQELAEAQPVSIAHSALASGLVTPISMMTEAVKTRLQALLPEG